MRSSRPTSARCVGRGATEKFNSPSFFVDELPISTALTKPTDDAKIQVALRHAEIETRPENLKSQQGFEMHHECTLDYPDGFKSICNGFIKAKGKSTLLSNICSGKPINAGLRQEFVDCHVKATESIDEHTRITAAHANQQ